METILPNLPIIKANEQKQTCFTLMHFVFGSLFFLISASLFSGCATVVSTSAIGTYYVETLAPHSPQNMNTKRIVIQDAQVRTVIAHSGSASAGGYSGISEKRLTNDGRFVKQFNELLETGLAKSGYSILFSSRLTDEHLGGIILVPTSSPYAAYYQYARGGMLVPLSYKVIDKTKQTLIAYIDILIGAEEQYSDGKCKTKNFAGVKLARRFGISGFVTLATVNLSEALQALKTHSSNQKYSGQKHTIPLGQISDAK
ncbi:MAG: hypothetical protein LBR07_08145 [Puniceicoccales bacterium]|jgi:hypothetical protein|nr:hypothetical protein [Puniceicoccales bacterium]